MKHFVVTGGAGFIGSHLVRHLLDRKTGTVTCIDNFDPFYPQKIKEHNISDFTGNPLFRLINVDLGKTTASELCNQIQEPVEVIIHLGAKAGVRPSIENPLSYQEANVIGLQNMLDFCREKQVKQFVFASSSSVYGINDHFPWKEDEQLMPISPYAMTKLAGEMLGHVYSKLYDIRFIALRFFTVYGPGQRPDLAIHKFTKAILTGKPITMYGDGNTSRDYTFIDDIVSGITGAMKYDKSSFEIINLGNNYPISLSELVQIIEKTLNKKAVIEHLPEQPGDVPRTYADISKAERLLNYDPQIQLKEGIKRFAEWFIIHKDILS